jgi:hypothetical protein
MALQGVRFREAPGGAGRERRDPLRPAHFGQRHDHAGTSGRLVLDITDESHGGRGYSCRDPEGHIWNFGTFNPWRRQHAKAAHGQRRARNWEAGIRRSVLTAVLSATLITSAMAVGWIYAPSRSLLEEGEPADAPVGMDGEATAMREQLARERSAREAAERAAKEAREQLLRERVAKETAERAGNEAREQLAREKSKAGNDQAVQDALARLEAERVAREAERNGRVAERTAREAAERAAAEALKQAAGERGERDAADKAAREAREQLAKERAARAAAERAASNAQAQLARARRAASSANQGGLFGGGQ